MLTSMAMEPRFGVILVAAGAGRRFGRRKAQVQLMGRTLLEHAAAPFAAFSDRVVVLHAADVGRIRLAGWIATAGGERRRDSVAAGLEALPAETTHVLVHDAARPLLSAALLERVVAAARDAAAVIPTIPIPDTIKEVAGRRVVTTPERARLVAVQTPQAFNAALLRRALSASSQDATDEASLVEAIGENVQTVPGDPENLKITTPLDLEFATAILAARSER